MKVNGERKTGNNLKSAGEIVALDEGVRWCKTSLASVGVQCFYREYRDWMNDNTCDYSEIIRDETLQDGVLGIVMLHC